MSLSPVATPNYYVRNLPANIPLKAAQGALVTAAIALLCGSAANVAILGGALAATVTLVEAVTRPIIRAIFSDVPVIGAILSFLTVEAVFVGLASSAAPWVGISYKASDFGLSLLAWFALNGITWYDRNEAVAVVF